jgi:hypothetical protein
LLPDIAPEDAILRQASPGHYNLIVMGVGRPGGEALFLAKWPRFSKILTVQSYSWPADTAAACFVDGPSFFPFEARAGGLLAGGVSSALPRRGA